MLYTPSNFLNADFYLNYFAQTHNYANLVHKVLKLLLMCHTFAFQEFAKLENMKFTSIQDG